jgi:ribosomal protein L20A (L18A)
MMKTKKKPVSGFQKTEARMKQETCRALAQVKFLEKLYRETLESKKKESK